MTEPSPPEHAAQTFEEFWPNYLLAHSHPLTRTLHIAGTLVCIVLVCLGLVLLNPWLPLIGVMVAYATAWISHALVEGNMPKTFSNPLWSLRADIAMLKLAVLGELQGEIDKASKNQRPASPSR